MRPEGDNGTTVPFITARRHRCALEGCSYQNWRSLKYLSFAEIAWSNTSLLRARWHRYSLDVSGRWGYHIFSGLRLTPSPAAVGARHDRIEYKVCRSIVIRFGFRHHIDIHPLVVWTSTPAATPAAPRTNRRLEWFALNLLICFSESSTAGTRSLRRLPRCPDPCIARGRGRRTTGGYGRGKLARSR